MRKPTLCCMHDGGSHLDRRPLTPDRITADQRKCAEQNLARGDSERNQRPHRIPARRQPRRRNDLRDTTALCAVEIATRQPNGRHANNGGQQKRQPRAILRGDVKNFERKISKFRKSDYCQSCRERSAPEHNSRPPTHPAHAAANDPPGAGCASDDIGAPPKNVLQQTFPHICHKKTLHISAHHPHQGAHQIRRVDTANGGALWKSVRFVPKLKLVPRERGRTNHRP